jgi:glycolate oxidase FAD binding subunit
LLRLGVTPSDAAELLTASELEGIPVELAAESGLGMAWNTVEPAGTAGAHLSSQAVMGLRQRCRQLGGYLTVLRQPAGAEMMAWEDATAGPLIEQIKAQFDPSGLLAPGRLPGVAQPRGLTPQGLASPFS